MKITLLRVEPGEEEIIIKYHQMSREIANVVEQLSGEFKDQVFMDCVQPSTNRDQLSTSCSQMSGRLLEALEETEDGGVKSYYLSPEEVYYFESVDGNVYACLEKQVYRIREKLEDVIRRYDDFGIVRCSRTMAVNLYKIEWLKSQPAGRILASLRNGEKVVISRKYAGLLRRKLKEGGRGHGRE